jgi:endonuclease/exonuclease/phosphatase family metal-dependent hydrolase
MRTCRASGKWLYREAPGQLQNIGIAVRTDTGKFLDPPFIFFGTNSDNRFGPFLIDTDNDDIKEQHRFERRPLYAEIAPVGGNRFRVFGLHLKSKGIFDALEWSRWWEKADANRKKILAEASEIRTKFLEPFLTEATTAGMPLIICGDINDGPGMDASEKRLFGSGVERLMGSVWKPNLCIGNALFDSLKPKDRDELDFSSLYTTSFKDPIFNGVYQHEWIDHVLYSKNQPGAWVSNAQIRTKMLDGSFIWNKYKHASDHFPVTVEVNT